MKTPVLVFIVAMLHVAAVGTLVMVQGCGTTRPSIEPDIAPVLPPGPVPSETTGVPPLAPARPERPMAMPAAPVPEIGSYTVKSGDSLSRIAQRNKISVRELMELNAIKDAHRIRVGQTILIPGYSGDPEPPKPPKSPAKSPAAVPAPSAPLTPGGEYVVQSGDILGRIAQRHGVKVRDLKAINHLSSDVIRPGQKLVIPAGGKMAEAPAPAPAPAPTPASIPEPAPVSDPVTPPPPADAQMAPVPAPVPPPPPAAGSSSNVEYPVVQGETVESIARAFLVSPEAIRNANNIPAGGQPAVGTVIIIPIPE